MTPLELLAKWGFCPFCLAIRSNSSYVRVIRKSGDAEECPPRILTRPVELTVWLAAQVNEWFSAFDMDGSTNMFVPVAVIGGIPLCGTHLWEETDPHTRRIRS